MKRVALTLVIAASLQAAPAAAYVRSRVPSGDACLWWGTRAVPWLANQEGSDDSSDGADLRAVRWGYQAWTDVPCSDLELVFGGLTSRRDVGYARSSEDNANLVLWRERHCDDAAPRDDPCWDCASSGGLCCAAKYHCWEQQSGIIAVTTTTFNRTSGQLVDADIELNGADYWFTTVDGPLCDDPRSPPTCASDADCSPGTRCFRNRCLQTGCARTDIQNTVTHEAGHVLGLDHTPDARATMFASAPEGEISKRSLEGDDVSGICDIYPDGDGTLTCFGDRVLIQPVSSTENVDGCLGCSGTAGGAGLLAAGLTLLPWLRRRVRGRS